jgi:hypothetical protein
MTPPAIVLVDYNGLADTRRCLESLSGQNADIIVVDNASIVDVQAALAGDFPNVHFVRSPINGGWAGGNNLGIMSALARGAELIVLLNNDTAVEPQFAERLLAAAKSHPSYGILGPVIRFLNPPHEVQTEGVTFNKPQQPGFFQRVPVRLNVTELPTIVDVDIVNGCCLMLSRSVVEKIGYVDEAFFLIHEEADFCLRAQEAGFKLGVLAESLVFHKGSSTFERAGQGTQRYYDARNLLRLLRKHRGRPGERSFLRGFVHTIRYALSRYALEREKGFRESADAVLAGLYDGLIGRYGPRSDRWRPGFAVLQRIVAAIWRIKGVFPRR